MTPHQTCNVSSRVKNYRSSVMTRNMTKYSRTCVIGSITLYKGVSRLHRGQAPSKGKTSVTCANSQQLFVSNQQKEKNQTYLFTCRCCDPPNFLLIFSQDSPLKSASNISAHLVCSEVNKDIDNSLVSSDIIIIFTNIPVSILLSCLICLVFVSPQSQ